MSALAIIVCILMTATAFYGCGNEDTATADTASKISTPDTPDTVQTTATVTTVESTTNLMMNTELIILNMLWIWQK